MKPLLIRIFPYLEIKSVWEWAQEDGIYTVEGDCTRWLPAGRTPSDLLSKKQWEKSKYKLNKEWRGRKN